jgi:hypothetical protein
MFPTGDLSMGNIRDGLGLPAGQVSMSQFRGKTLYNPDGSTYTVPASGSLGINYFKGKNYVRPAITQLYDTGATSISKPAGTNPTKVTITLYGAGAGGSAGFNASFKNINGVTTGVGGASGGGGGSGGKSTTPTIAFTNQTITCSIGAGGTAGYANSDIYNDLNFGGGKGGNTTVTINGTTYTAYGAAATASGGWGVQAGGTGGTGTTQNGNNGQTGLNGGTCVNPWTFAAGGASVSGGTGIDGYGAGGSGSIGAYVQNGSAYSLRSVPNNLAGAGANGKISVLWQFN